MSTGYYLSGTGRKDAPRHQGCGGEVVASRTLRNYRWVGTTYCVKCHRYGVQAVAMAEVAA